MVQNKESLVLLRLAVQYIDNFVKCQSWGEDFISVTDRLVFDPALMQPSKRLKFAELRRDWGNNPCLGRYRIDGRAAFYCLRGKDSLSPRHSPQPTRHPFPSHSHLEAQNSTP